MTLSEWLNQLKIGKPAASDFIKKVEPYISDTGLNAQEFERKVSNGLTAIDKEVDKLFNS